MKRKSTLMALALTAIALTAQAQRTPTHPLDIATTDETNWINTFMNWQPGKTIGNVSRIDDEFFISRVKPKKRIGEANGDYSAETGADSNRKMCLWTPLDDPTSTWKAFPRYCFEGDNFSLWNYLDIHGNWTAPWIRCSAGLADVAAKNGVKVGTLMSIPWQVRINLNWGSGTHETTLRKLTDKNSQGKYKYAAKLVQYMKYYGVNGIGVNSEFVSDPNSMDRLINFFAECHQEGKKQDWDFQVYWYDGTNSSGSITFDAGLGEHNIKMFGTSERPVTDMLFFNYGWSKGQLNNSVRRAERVNRSGYDIYAGFDIQGRALRLRGDDQSWRALSETKASVGFWGAHSQSLLHQSATDDGTSDLAIQKAYLLKQELCFSGGYRNPAYRPSFTDGCNLSNASLKNFHGLASLLTAKSTITAVPFVSRFNLGNGLKFRNEGEVTFDHKWHNINTQDLMPTWRWWITNAEDRVDAASYPSLIKAELTFDDAYFGGSCLSIEGKTPASHVKLFKTMLDVKPDYTLSITYKMPENPETHAKLFVALKGETANYKTVNIPNEGKAGQWVTFTAKMSDLGLAADATVAMIGLKFENTPANYKMLVGEMALRNPAQTFNTKKPTVAEVQVLRGRYNAFDFKMRYYSDDGTGTTKTYNDDVDTWYYEIYVQPKNGNAQMLTATTSWAAYVVDAPVSSDKDNRMMRMGVRAVSPDGLHHSDIAWSDWTNVAYDQPLHTAKLNKSVIKPGEPFVVSLEDLIEEPAQRWEIIRASDNQTVFSAQNTTSCNVTINEIGVYDLKLVDSEGKEHNNRGFIQISPESTGAVPHIETIAASKQKVDKEEQVKYSYTGKQGNGKVSRGLIINDPNMFRMPADLQQGTTYSYALWFKADGFKHDKQGTNLINKNTIKDSWPHNNWGDLWVTIRPQWNGHEANEISFNVMGWKAHDSPKENMMSTGYQVVPGVWTHVVVTQDGGIQRIYFNGKQVANAFFGDSKRREDRTDDGRVKRFDKADIFIGGGNVYKAGFNGVIDEVQVWDKALSPEEVKQCMNGFEKGKAPQGLRGYYTFEEKTNDGKYANWGTAGEQFTGDVVAIAQSGGEKTENAYYDLREDNNNVLGNPGIPGTLEVKTEALWTLDGARVIEKGDVATVAYAAAGHYGATLKLVNRWGEDTKTVANLVEVTNTTNSINGVKAADFALYPNPFVESVNLRFAEAGVYTIQVATVNGAVMQNTKATANAGDVVNVAITGAKGLYIVRVLKNGKQYKAVKVVKE